MSSFKKGGIIILSSPSGAGKTTLVKKISKNKKFTVSISHTTRSPRPNEKDGKDYYFVSKNNFKKLIKKKEFLEHAKVFDNYYGSSKEIVINKLQQGKNIIFDIVWYPSVPKLCDCLGEFGTAVSYIKFEPRKNQDKLKIYLLSLALIVQFD